MINRDFKNNSVFNHEIGNEKIKAIQFIVTAAILIGVVLLSGCLNPFAPKLTNSLEGGDMIITSQATPQEALQNFKIAYTFRDSLLYSDVLDTGFLFVYFDPNEGTSGRLVSWGREEDLLTTGRLFRHFEVIDLVWNETIYENEGETLSEISRGFSLTLVGENSTYTLAGRAVFTFEKSKDLKWRITRWKDESDL
jgi:hypothetical protein